MLRECGIAKEITAIGYYGLQDEQFIFTFNSIKCSGN